LSSSTVHLSLQISEMVDEPTLLQYWYSSETESRVPYYRWAFTSVI